VELLTNTECLSVLTSEDGRRVTGVRIRQANKESIVFGKTIALCGGFIDTPRLLWRSRNDKHPNGLGNSQGALGQNVAAHAGGTAFPIIGLRRLTPLHD